MLLRTSDMRTELMRTVLVVLVVVVVVTLGAAAACPATAQSVCLAADSLGAAMLEQISLVASSNDPQMATSRQHMQLPQVAATQVVFVTDTRVCSRARDAYTAAIRRTDGVQPSGRVYVLKVGTVYVVNDPVQLAGEFQIRMTLSSDYKILAKYS
jgi:hypothetical protein